MLDDNQLELPSFLKRDTNNRAEFVKMEEQVTEIVEQPPAKPVKAPKAKVKAKPKVKAKAAKPAVKAKAKVKQAKEKKPRGERLETDQFGLRKSSTKSQAAAMYARKSGATLGEVKNVVGSIQLNVLNELEAEGWPVERKKEQRNGERSVTRYWLRAKK